MIIMGRNIMGIQDLDQHKCGVNDQTKWIIRNEIMRLVIDVLHGLIVHVSLYIIYTDANSCK
jgi:hypothetical protein